MSAVSTLHLQRLRPARQQTISSQTERRHSIPLCQQWAIALASSDSLAQLAVLNALRGRARSHIVVWVRCFSDCRISLANDSRSGLVVPAPRYGSLPAHIAKKSHSSQSVKDVCSLTARDCTLVGPTNANFLGPRRRAARLSVLTTSRTSLPTPAILINCIPVFPFS
jgi:hypothetical protein